MNPWNVTFYIVGIAAARFTWATACGISPVSGASRSACGRSARLVGSARPWASAFTLMGMAIVLGLHYGDVSAGGYVHSEDHPKIIIVGGGLAGLMATIRVAESGVPVELFSIVPVKRSHSVCAQGGINAAKNLKGEGDSTWKHFDDTIYGGDFLANQPLVKAMCEAAPAIIDLLDRMGVMFNRTPEGLLDFRRFGGTLYHRTAFAGATTGQQLLYALDEQVRRFESEGKVKKFEGWTFLSAVLDDDGVCRGICAMDLKTMEIKTFPCDAAIFCTGGIGAIFGRSTNSVVCTGSAQSALFQQGAYYANGEFIQVHPPRFPAKTNAA